jgi:hypothetical protein
MARKHEDILTDKLVLWSASGFTQPAFLKAKKLGIETVTCSPDTRPAWAVVARDLVGASVKLVTSKMTPVIYVDAEDGTERQWDVVPDTIIIDTSNGDQAPISVLMEITQQHPMFGNTLLDHAVDGANDYYATYHSPVPLNVICPDGVTRPLKLLVFAIKATAAMRPVKSKSALHQDRVTTLAEATMHDGTFKFVVRETVTAAPQTRATMEPAKKKKKNSSKTKAKRRTTSMVSAKRKKPK